MSQGIISTHSFDHYNNITLEFAADSTGVITAGAGRKGTSGVVTTYSSTFFVEELKVLNEVFESGTLYLGFSLKLTALPASDATLLCLMETDNTAHVTLGILTDGTIRAYRGVVGGTTLASSASPIGTTLTYYFEVKAIIDNATGNVTVKLWTNENTNSTVINFTGDTQNGGTGLLSNVGFASDRASGIPVGASWDDIYIRDDAFWGNKHMQAEFPDGAGFYTQWTPSPSPPNYSNVNENPPDGNVTYNFAPTTIGDNDSFTMQDVSTADTVDAVMVKLCTALDAANANGVAALMRYNSTDLITQSIVPSTSYLIYQFPFATVADGTSWTTAKFNASEAGYAVSAANTFWMLPYLSIYNAGTDVSIPVANQVQVLRVFVPYNILVSRMDTKVGTSAGGKFWSAGLYTEDMNTLVIDSGPLSTTIAGFKASTFSPVLVEAGMYWYAWTCDSLTPTVVTGQMNIVGVDIRENGTEQYGHATNTSVAGQLPATMGGFTADTPVADGVPLTALH